MEYFRDELLPNVYLTALQTDKFKTARLRSVLLAPLRRETASARALIPSVLRRGTAASPDRRALAARLEGLYGARLDTVVTKRGEIQCLGFQSAFCEDAFLPAGAGLLEALSRLMGELWLSPNTRGGLFLPDYVNGERELLLQNIDAMINDKRTWALHRLMEHMCAWEDYAVDALGNRETAEALRYTRLTKDYRALLASAPMELFYCGARPAGQVREALLSALQAMPRGEPEEELGTDIRMNAMEAEPRVLVEELDVTQGNLAVGFRLGSCMEEPDPAALRVFNAVYGGSVNSKLFRNVRERLSLCYYASSMLDLHKGIMAVTSGIDFDKYDPALREILAQLDAVKRGDITDEELDAAKKTVVSQLLGIEDSPAALESFYFDQALLGLDYGPRETAALAEEVTREEVAAIAAGVECDAVFFLRGQEERA